MSRGRAALLYRTRPRATFIALTLAVAACSTPPGGPALTQQQLMDPASCKTCHPDAYREWSGSMHAYASEDPVFRAMNQRGQRETNGALGTFCLNCHAPMAVRTGATTDGSNLDTLPESLKGVTCYFCHSVDAVEGTHNNPLRLANDGVMRGGHRDPMHHGAHASAWSPLLDRDQPASATMCGSCHDVQNGHGVDLERTFAEWKDSVFSRTEGGATCGQCHMPASLKEMPASTMRDSPLRRVHDHSMPGVDVAITPFPEREEQRRLVEEALAGTVQSALCVLPQGADSRLQLVLDNGGAGHGFPSGATSDRRFWAEVTAEQGGVPLYSSGVVPEGAAVAELSDPDLWLVRSCLYDDAGESVHQFWEAHEKVSNTLPTMETLDPTDPRYYGRHRSFDYPGPGRTLGGEPDVVRVRLWMEPIGREVLRSLVESGDLAPEHAAAMPTLPVGPVLEWRADGPRQPWIDPVTGEEWSCVTDTGIELRAARTAAKSHAKCERE